MKSFLNLVDEAEFEMAFKSTPELGPEYDEWCDRQIAEVHDEEAYEKWCEEQIEISKILQKERL